MTKNNGVDVAILCGGFGSRLKPVVADRAKPMADVGGVPFLSLLIDEVAAFGFRRFVLCVGHLAGSVESHQWKREDGTSIVFSREKRPLGTAGAVRNAAGKLCGDTVLVLNGDSICRMNYRKFLAFHLAQKARATIAVSRMQLSGDYGEVVVGWAGVINAFREKTRKDRKGWVNAGVYAFDASVLKELPARVPLSLERDVFPEMVGKGLVAFRTRSTFLDIGTPERYALARGRLSSGAGSFTSGGRGWKSERPLDRGRQLTADN